MSRIESKSPARAALLDMATAVGPEEAEFIEALRRLVARTPAQDLWDKYRSAGPDQTGRILARYAD